MSKNWAICIGVNGYHNLKPLKYARRDAAAMRDFCLGAGFEKVYFFAEEVDLIRQDYGPPLRSEPTIGSLERFLRVRFEEAFLEAGDNLWFFFAGHGKRFKGKDYLMPVDGDPGNVGRTGLAIRDISDRLRRCGADNIIMMLDACRGEDDRDGGEGIGVEKQQGVITLFSCSPNELSYEIDELEQGSFTYSLLQGLRIQGEGNCATVERLYQHLRYQVPELNQRYKQQRQTPYAIAEPATKLHLILLPGQATLQDVQALKVDALEAEAEVDWDLAEQLWTRVLVVSPGDRQAVKALQRVAVRRIQHPSKTGQLTVSGSSQDGIPDVERLSRGGAAATSVSSSLVSSPKKLYGSDFSQSRLNLIPCNEDLACSGDPDAISLYLSKILMALDVGVRVSIRTIPGMAHLAREVVTASKHPVSESPGTDLISRLWIFCRANYSPDRTLVALPTAQRLRDLKLTQFQDAVLTIKIEGEDDPDWRLLVDLTPPEEILKKWARWGDLESINRLLNTALAPLAVTTTSELKDATLHLICHPLVTGIIQSSAESEPPATEMAIEINKVISALLDHLGPQGIQRAQVYGPYLNGLTPTWFERLELPAADNIELALSAEALAQRGNLPAIAYCLTRRLNPDLDEQLATGGVRVRVFVKDKRLHVMIDGPLCPPRQVVAPPVLQFLQQQQLKNIDEIRIYGRRAGQKHPDWTDGFDFRTKAL